ncbi:MAG TPA: HD domain-containing protein [Mobilitalea sp.]|nr:HD domain-containing protein [Mobilitalea sp.]
MLPNREEAEELLREAERCNPGPWGNHSRVAAHCAERIALECDDLDSNKAYILGLLHDIGRKFGVRHMGHISDGYSYMMSLGYDEDAQICLTHSFNNQTIDEYIGKIDTNEEELKMIQDELKATTMDEYDRLIQLCDSLAGAEGVLDIHERMGDVKRRYGSYPQAKWDNNLALKKHFEEKVGKDIYEVIDKYSSLESNYRCDSNTAIQ